jgi:hypothetical protein
VAPSDRAQADHEPAHLSWAGAFFHLRAARRAISSSAS